MPSKISQMRGQTQTSQQIVNERARSLMQQFKSASNPSLILTNLIQQNPQLATIISGGNLENIARSMAQARNIDINQLITNLTLDNQ